MFSIVVLTKNEERALPDCLSSAAYSNDIVVLDSGSTDRTLEIAERSGARIVKRPFDTFAKQRNYAQQSIGFRNSWVFHLDADERLTPELLAECEAASKRTDIDGFRVAPKMIFEGRWIRHCTDYPAFQARLVRAPEFEFVQVGHGQREAPGMRLENLSAGYLHDIFIYGTDSWIEKHRKYAKDEAQAISNGSHGPYLINLFSPDKIVRRRALKRLSFAMPFRPLLRFIYQYGLRGGFLDGPQGLRYCRLLSRYEGFVAEEMAKLQKKS